MKAQKSRADYTKQNFIHCLAWQKYIWDMAASMCLYAHHQIRSQSQSDVCDNNQCDQIWRNFATLAKNSKSLGMSKYSYISCTSIYLVTICSYILT